jgi:hypothetical protein
MRIKHAKFLFLSRPFFQECVMVPVDGRSATRTSRITRHGAEMLTGVTWAITYVYTRCSEYHVEKIQ